MEILKKILSDKRLETWLWETANALIIISISIIADIDWFYAPIAIAILNQVTKWINVNLLKE